MSGAWGRAGGTADATHRTDDRRTTSPPQRAGGPARPRLPLLVALAATPLLAGCSLLSPAPAPTVTVTSSATASMHDPSADPTPPATTSATPTTKTAATPAPSTVSTLAGGDGSAVPFVLPPAALPAGFVVAEPRDTGGYRMTVCGVDLEPNTPVDAAQARWQQSPSGPFLEQHVRVYTGDTARDVVGRLRTAIPGCRTYAQGGQTYRVTPLAVPGATRTTATWRQAATLTLPTPAPSSSGTATAPTTPTAPATSAPARTATLTQDVAVVQRGKAVELLVSYAVDAAPQPGVIAAAVKGAVATG